jgi:hypothetical protein
LRVHGAAVQGEPRPPQLRLDSVERLRCVFTTGVVGAWRRPTPEARTTAGTALLTLEISDIDLSDGSASVRRGGPRRTVSVRSDRSNLYFFEVDPAGTAMLTTVFSQEVDGRLKATHSETGTGARQLYGSCAVPR